MIHYVDNRTFLDDSLFTEEENDSYHDTVKKQQKEWRIENEEPDKDSLHIVTGRD